LLEVIMLVLKISEKELNSNQMRAHAIKNWQ
jgi:hypothetical protein